MNYRFLCGALRPLCNIFVDLASLICSFLAHELAESLMGKQPQVEVSPEEAVELEKEVKAEWWQKKDTIAEEGL
jgi:hypothetical protein